MVTPWVQQGGGASPEVPAALFDSASTPVHNDSYATSPVVITPPASMVTGQLVVVGVFSKTNAPGVTVDNTGGQTWIDEGLFTVGTNRGIHVMWCIYDGTWDASPAWALATPNQTITAIMRVWTPTTGYAWHATDLDAEVVANGAGGPADPFDFTVTGVMTTAARTVAMGFGFTTVDNELAVQTAGWGYLSVDNIAGTDSGAIAFDRAFTSAGPTGDIVIRQTADGGASWFGITMAFKEA